MLFDRENWIHLIQNNIQQIVTDSFFISLKLFHDSSCQSCSSTIAQYTYKIESMSISKFSRFFFNTEKNKMEIYDKKTHKCFKKIKSNFKAK